MNAGCRPRDIRHPCRRWSRVLLKVKVRSGMIVTAAHCCHLPPTHFAGNHERSYQKLLGAASTQRSC
jgi:hypothetical protein